MAILYRVFERENKFPGAKNPKLAYATPKQVGVIKLKELAEDISDRCTVHRADVMAVLDVLSISTISFLNKGLGVELGELGRFSIRMKSKSTASKDEFTPDLIRGAMIRYTPSVEMKSRLANCSFMSYESLFAKDKAPKKEEEVNDPGESVTPTPGEGGSSEGGI